MSKAGPCSVVFSPPDDPCGAEPNSPGSTRARWLHFAEHFCLAPQCETSPMQLQKNVFFGFFPPAVPLWQEGKVEQRGRRGNVLLYCCFLRHQEGKDENSSAALPLPIARMCKIPEAVLAEPQSYKQRRKAFVSFSGFYLKIHPRGEEQALHIPYSHTEGPQPTALSPLLHFLGRFVSFVFLFPL